MLNLDIPAIAAAEQPVPTEESQQDKNTVQPALEITPSATARLRTLMQTQERPALKLRIRIRGGGCSGFQYNFDLTDEAKEDDIFWRQDDTCIIVDPLSQQMLNGAQLEYFHSPMESGFRLNNPHAKTQCGCGVSFSV